MSTEKIAHRDRMARLAKKDDAQDPNKDGPPDPKECPEGCKFLGEDGNCTETECVREEIAYWDNIYSKSERV